MGDSAIDLSPFGFTPTESLAYAFLLRRGPTTAYALARALGLARANAYQALDGLTVKDACELVGRNPKIYRAADPRGLLAKIAEDVLGSLDRLEAQLHQGPVDGGGPVTTSFSTERAFRELVLRTTVRAEELFGVGPGAVLVGLNPIWRKRAADGLATHLWSVGAPSPELPIPLAGTVTSGRAKDLFGVEPVVVVVETVAIVGRRAADGLGGYWTSDPLLTATATGTVHWLTRP